MRAPAVVILYAFNLFALGNAYGHGDHKPMHGGDVGRGSEDIVVEFVMENGALTLYVHDEVGNPLATKNLTGTLTLIPPARPAQEVELVWSGYHTFTAPGIEPVIGERLVARIILPTGEKLESLALFSQAKPDKPRLSFTPGAFVLPVNPSVTGDRSP